jgi:hypothetical protein
MISCQLFWLALFITFLSVRAELIAHYNVFSTVDRIADGKTTKRFNFHSTQNIDGNYMIQYYLQYLPDTIGRLYNDTSTL